MQKKKIKPIKTDELALMIKAGFDKVDERFDKVDERFDKVEGRLEKLERGQEEIKLKFGYVAWAIDLEELKRRMEILEKKVGIGNK